MTGLGARDAKILAALCALPAAYFLLLGALGLTSYWGDLTYIHYGWRALAAQTIQAGRLPLWNPYAYFGMPLAGQMQSAVWYPGTLLFHLFGFAGALPAYQALHFALAAAGGYLWLRSLSFSRAACAAGAAVFMLCGGMVSRIPFLNHSSTLALFPFLLLVSRRPVLAALALALGFLSGYPTMLAGAAAAAFFFDAARAWAARPGEGGKLLKRWGAAAALSAGLSACLLLPAMELAGHSRRSSGVESAEAVTWSFAPRDFLQLTAPPLIPGDEYRPDVNWWKTAYFGAAAGGLAAAGLWTLPPAAAAGALAYLFSVFLLMLGDSTAASAWLWESLPPLRFVRYPGNMAYLLIPAVAWLAAAGAAGRKRAPWLALGVAVELGLYAAFSQPLAPSAIWTDAGPLVGALRDAAGGHRYMLSPRALQWHQGRGTDSASAAVDLKNRLYGLSNLPYRLESAANFGEPLVPAGGYALMDFLFSRQSLFEAARWLPWADVRVLLARERLDAGELKYLGENLWHLFAVGRPARAYWLPQEAGAALGAELKEPPSPVEAEPLQFERPREDRYRVTGSAPAPGWVFVAEPDYPGWRGPEREPAMAAFYKVRVPAGEIRLDFRYAPASWAVGSALTALFLGALGAYCYNRLRRTA